MRNFDGGNTHAVGAVLQLLESIAVGAVVSVAGVHVHFVGFLRVATSEIVHFTLHHIIPVVSISGKTWRWPLFSFGEPWSLQNR